MQFSMFLHGSSKPKFRTSENVAFTCLQLYSQKIQQSSSRSELILTINSESISHVGCSIWITLRFAINGEKRRTGVPINLISNTGTGKIQLFLVLGSFILTSTLFECRSQKFSAQSKSATRKSSCSAFCGLEDRADVGTRIEIIMASCQ